MRHSAANSAGLGAPILAHYFHKRKGRECKEM
jgi:hypothetical protein